MAQLNQMQRYAIYLYLKEKKTQAYIAGQLNVSKSTISRELKRNGGKRGYSWRQAQLLVIYLYFLVGCYLFARHSYYLNFAPSMSMIAIGLLAYDIYFGLLSLFEKIISKLKNRKL